MAFIGMLFAALITLAGCSDESNPGAVSQCVDNAYPLEVGNRWEYVVEQSVFVEHQDSTRPPTTVSSTGRQIVTITRTEAIKGDEAFGVLLTHYMGQLFDTGEDTTMEIHYLAPHGDKIYLRAKQFVYNTGNFIPLAKSDGVKKTGMRYKVGGESRVITLERLARMLLDPAGWNLSLPGTVEPFLSSDGLQNRDDVVFYENDYILVFKNLCKGRNWISEEAEEIGGIEVSQKVTNILDELSGFQGPIAEVELTNTFIEATDSEEFRIRYYYKSGVGIVQAEISDPNIPIFARLPDGGIEYLGIGTWTVIKTLVDYTVK